MRTRIKDTHKFGNKRYVLKWDSATFTTYHSPNSVSGVAEKKRMAKYVLSTYRGGTGHDDWWAKITTYRGGKDFKVWALPRYEASNG